MKKDHLKSWAAPVLAALSEIERAISETKGDASMLKRVQAMVGELPSFDWLALADGLADDMVAGAAESVHSWADNFARAPKEAALADGDTFEPIDAAAEKVRAKLPVGTRLRSKGLADLPLAFRERAQFSAGVESERVMTSIQRRIEEALSHQKELLSNGKDRYVTRDSFIRSVRQVALDEGLDTGQGDVLTNIVGKKRLGLIYDMQTEQARGYARWKLDNDVDALAILPAWRLGQSSAMRPRGDQIWMSRWYEAGEAVGWAGASRRVMAALKTSPIWARLSRFGTPWPPFDFGSTRELEDVWRDEAERLGLVEPAEKLKPVAEQRFNESLRASAAEIAPQRLANLVDFFGASLRVVGDVIEWVTK